MEFNDYVNLILIVVMLIITIHYIFNKLYKIDNSSKVIPGLEKSDDIFGNLLEIEKCGSLHQFLENLHGKFGDIASFYWEDTKVVSICNHEFFKTVQHLFNRPALIFRNFSDFIGENCIQFCNGIEGRNRRDQYDKPFHYQAIIRYVTIFEKVGQENLEQMKSPIESIEHMCCVIAMKSILKACFTPIEKNDEFYDKAISLYLKIFGNLTNDWTKRKTIHNDEDDTKIQLDKDMKEFYSMIRTIIDERLVVLERENMEESELMLIDHIILYHRDTDKGLVEKEVMVYMIAGFHTTGHALSWCIYYLSKDQKCQDKLYEEISSQTLNFSNTLECYKTILNMKYLRSCIDETFRMCQLGPYAARVSDEEIRFRSFRVPADTPIILALGVSFKNENVFKNNEKFIPERFLDNHMPSFAFVPFGFAGRRRCPGERFAYLELSILLIQLIGKYSFYLHNPDQEVHKKYGSVTQMKEKCSVIFTER